MRMIRTTIPNERMTHLIKRPSPGTGDKGGWGVDIICMTPLQNLMKFRV